MKNNTLKNQFNICGGVSFRIILVAATLCLIGGSMFFIIDKQNKKSKTNHRKAIELSDYGFQFVMERESLQLSKDPSKIKGVERTEYNNGWYKVSITTTLVDSLYKIDIESKGTSGAQTVIQKKKITLKKLVDTDEIVWIPQLMQ